jgi:hypothetical protein
VEDTDAVRKYVVLARMLIEAVSVKLFKGKMYARDEGLKRDSREWASMSN